MHIKHSLITYVPDSLCGSAVILVLVLGLGLFARRLRLGGLGLRRDLLVWLDVFSYVLPPNSVSSPTDTKTQRPQ